MADSCPVCKLELRKTESRGDRHFIECLRCGSYSLSAAVQMILPGELGKEEYAAAKLSYALYRMTKRDRTWPMLSIELLRNILSNTEFPRPQEQFENLILWLGENQPHMGLAVRSNSEPSVISACGATDQSDVNFLVAQGIESGLVDGKYTRGEVENDVALLSPIKLSMQGWRLFEELQRGKASGRNAFMAMKFGDPELDRVFADHFKPAIKTTGFDLKRLDEGQPAGLIDDRLRVEIRQSRFLIADLTHNNNGAYWEAGYAEGLGKPVIYTCRKNVFDNPKEGTHFDTNHHLTVVWEPDKLPEAAEKLKATIRATLPEEAKLSD